MKKFTFIEDIYVGAQETVIELDKKQVTVKNIDKIIAEQNLDYGVKVVYVRWETERTVQRSYQKKTVYKDNLYAFKMDASGQWSKEDISSTRTI